MGLFNEKASVNLNDVSLVRDKVNSLYKTINYVSQEVRSSVSEIINEGKSKLNELNGVVLSNRELYSSIQELKRGIEQEISYLKTVLSRTPKDLEYEEKNSEGDVVVKKKPNPEYYQLQKEISKSESKLSKVKDLSFDVYNDVSYFERRVSDLSLYINEIEENYKKLIDKMNSLFYNAERAIKSLDNIIYIIEKYISYNIKI